MVPAKKTTLEKGSEVFPLQVSWFLALVEKTC